ncbi:MAG: methionine--tRNA ligase subunit beta, partial [Clostridia bacterium]
DAPPKILAALGESVPALFDGQTAFGTLKAGGKVSKSDKLFERLDVEKEIAALEKMAAEQDTAATSNDTEKAANENSGQADKASETAKADEKAMITIDDFAKVELKVGVIKTAEKLKKSKKLLKFTVDVGGEERTILSGIAKDYAPEDTIGKEVIVVTNLAPAKLCGEMSEGMLLCAEDKDGKIILLSPEKTAGSGSGVS